MASNLKGENLDFLNDVGSSKGVFESLDSLSNTDKLILQIAKKFIKKAQYKINKAKAIDRGDMLDIKILDNSLNNKKLQLLIGYTSDNPASKYWQFQDKGVVGVKKDKTKGSPYKYKSLGVGKDMLAKIIAWYSRHKNYIKNETQIRNLSSLQKKRSRIAVKESDKLSSVAYATARKIKREGLKTIDFSKYAAEQTFNEEFFIQLAKGLGNDFLDNLQK